MNTTTHNRTEPDIEHLDVRDDAPDGLALLVDHTLKTRSGFRDVWEPLALVRQIEAERTGLGLSQAEVAERMGLARTAVAKLENNPDGVAFGRVMVYARAVGVELTPRRSKERPKPQPEGKGRRVRPAATA